MDTVELTRRLLAFDTVNPPGNESACAQFLAGVLGDAGFDTRTYDFEPQRTTLVATLRSTGTKRPIVLTGHLDVVPLGAAPWSVDPFTGAISDGRLYGRGACDMKGAVAAMVNAGKRIVALEAHRADVILVLTAGEERCCEGAQHLTQQSGALPRAGALVVGEPTGNRPFIAHKGCVRFSIKTSGVTAHASMPEQGDNAVHKAAEAVLALRHFEFGVDPHPLLGRPTLNVGTIRGGMNINSVPDAAVIGVDIRTIPGQTDDAIQSQLQACVGEHPRIERTEGAGAIASPPDDPWIGRALTIIGKHLGESVEPGSATYFTDAAYLKPCMGDPPTLILGPGEPEMAHKTDEYVEVAKLAEAEEIYFALIRDWVAAA